MSSTIATSVALTASASAEATAAARNQDAEEGLRKKLSVALESLQRREPLEPTYKRFLMNGLVSTKRPLLPKDKFYKRIGSDLRHRVESFNEQTRGKDPLDRISQRLPLQEEHMRAALTLREAKTHEQKALLDVTLSVLPRRYGMDSASRRRMMEGIAAGLTTDGSTRVFTGSSGLSRARNLLPHNSTMSASLSSKLPSTLTNSNNDSKIDCVQQQTEQARLQARVDQQKAEATAREDARQRRDQAERQRRDDTLLLNRTPRIETPQHALHKIYHPIFKKLWDMEFPLLGNINPFRIVIDRDNCASCGAPDYFDVIDTPMNLTYIQQKVETMEYVSLHAFFQDVELMISNALLYNADPSNPYRVAADEMKKRYCKIAKKVVQTLQKKQQTTRPPDP